jgi:predicted dithiol-disulfide oxidoreductase (DUF899 family)
MALPEFVSREEWLEARLRLLAREKEQTRLEPAQRGDESAFGTWSRSAGGAV